MSPSLSASDWDTQSTFLHSLQNGFFFPLKHRQSGFILSSKFVFPTMVNPQAQTRLLGQLLKYWMVQKIRCFIIYNQMTNKH